MRDTPYLVKHVVPHGWRTTLRRRNTPQNLVIASWRENAREAVSKMQQLTRGVLCHGFADVEEFEGKSDFSPRAFKEGELLDSFVAKVNAVTLSPRTRKRALPSAKCLAQCLSPVSIARASQTCWPAASPIFTWNRAASAGSSGSVKYSMMLWSSNDSR